MKLINKMLPFLLLLIIVAGCQKMERPALGDYPKDVNPPGGPLKFYVAFDGTTNDPLMNAVDSVRANFPSDNPWQSTDGIAGKGAQGGVGKYLKYAKPNDWASTAKSFTVAVWFQSNGTQLKNNVGGNGPEYFMSLKAVKDYHWSNAAMFFFLEGNNDACLVKLMTVDKNKADHWFEWTGGQALTGILDSKWHHIAFVYNASTSTATLYVDGVPNPNTKAWGGHGDINFDDSKIAEMQLGSGPLNTPTPNIDDEWLASSWKGKLDQFRLYGTALTAGEVSALFSSKK